MVEVARQEMIDHEDAVILAQPASELHVALSPNPRLLVEVVIRTPDGRYEPVLMNERGEIICREGEKLYLVPIPSTVFLPNVGEVPCEMFDANGKAR